MGRLLPRCMLRSLCLTLPASGLAPAVADAAKR